MRNKKYYNKLTSLHINDELHEKAIASAKEEDLYFYELLDKLLKEHLESKNK